MFYGIDYKNNVEHYFAYHVSLLLHFGKMDSFFVHISKIGLKALYYKALSHFLATILSTMPDLQNPDKKQPLVLVIKTKKPMR